MYCVQGNQDIVPEAHGIIIVRVQRNPGKRVAAATELGMPCAQQGCLAPAGRRGNQGSCAARSCGQQSNQARAFYESGGRSGNEQFRGQQHMFTCFRNSMCNTLPRHSCSPLFGNENYLKQLLLKSSRKAYKKTALYLNVSVWNMCCYVNRSNYGISEESRNVPGNSNIFRLY